MASDNVSQNDQFATDAVLLIQRAWESYDEYRGTGFMSSSIYDTAWVSMVAKAVDGEIQWLFPESFDYLLRTQSEDGSWGATTTASQIDGILNTAASLLSLYRHHSKPLNTPDHALEGLGYRIQRATASLASQLQRWDVAAAVHVAFEVTVPTLLELLRAEDPFMVLEFDGEKHLMQIFAAKMSRFKPESLYEGRPSTVLHSLEAFTAKVDMDRLGHHKVGGSMMGSPSSTAAYLMHVTNWDVEAESYLRYVIQFGVGRGKGAVPSAFPSTFFEYTWILSTILRAGFSVADIYCPELDSMKRLLEQALERGEGIIGFAPSLPADVDDTAKCIISLHKLNRQVSPAAMIDAFETNTHFRTYDIERNPSFTANCNVLSALLVQPDPSLYSMQILKITEFLCRCWWEGDGSVQDKWNTSPLYPSLLVVQAFVDLFIQVEQGKLESLGHELQARVHVTLYQACLRALLSEPDPSSAEQIAYSLLILCEARRLTLFHSLRCRINASINRQVSLLGAIPEFELKSDANRIWIEKVSYSSQLLTQSYRLAAFRAATRPQSAITVETSYGPIHSVDGSSSEYVKLLKETLLFESTPKWELEASMLEATLFQPLLQRRRLDIFPRMGMEKDKYFDLIPFTWTSCNNRKRTFAPTKFLYEMMVVSFLDFQADEFMEAVAGPTFQGREDSLHRLVDDIFTALGNESPGQLPDSQVDTRSSMGGSSANGINGVDGSSQMVTDGHSNGCASYGRGCNSKQDQNEDQVREILTRFATYIALHPSVQSASSWDRTSTLRELRIYLHAHVTQSEDNIRMAKAQVRRDSMKQMPTQATVTGISSSYSSYFRWVRGTSADHTACPYSFAFAGCLLSAQREQQQQQGGIESFPTGKTKYFAAATCQHLATMCRMYNDYGSIARDEAEGNLNSVGFAEFGDEDVLEAKKSTLFDLAQYERLCFEDSMRRLSDEAKNLGRSRQMVVLAMFCDVTDLYGQIYVVRDIASRMVKSKISGEIEGEIGTSIF